jgi:hypothetical protein
MPIRQAILSIMLCVFFSCEDAPSEPEGAISVEIHADTCTESQETLYLPATIRNNNTFPIYLMCDSISFGQFGHVLNAYDVATADSTGHSYGTGKYEFFLYFVKILPQESLSGWIHLSSYYFFGKYQKMIAIPAFAISVKEDCSKQPKTPILLKDSLADRTQHYVEYYYYVETRDSVHYVKDLKIRDKAQFKYECKRLLPPRR